MSDLILHHYWISPYADKIRRIMGFKSLAWTSVEIPMVAPKPDLTALTGGYRKTPVLQIGADVYCDTDCIVRALERIAPEPTLFPAGGEAVSVMLGSWQQELFWLAVQVAGTSGDVFPEGFVEDRNEMIPGGLDLEKMVAEIPATNDRLRAKLDLLERGLANRDYLLGDAPSLADFSLFHPVFALKNLGAAAAVLEPFPAVRAWAERVEAVGYGDMTAGTAADALAAARDAEPATATAEDAGDPNGRRPGETVSIVHEFFGNDPVVGELVASDAQEIAVRRSDERTGDVVVHLPREHYVVSSAG